MGPFTPASYDIPSIMSIGGTTQKGQLAWFSNYGLKSVDVFAPGDDIITLYGKRGIHKMTIFARRKKPAGICQRHLF